VLRDGDGIVTVQDAVVVPHHDRGVPGHQMRIGVGVLRPAGFRRYNAS
jgi:hypothetical protein